METRKKLLQSEEYEEKWEFCKLVIMKITPFDRANLGLSIPGLFIYIYLKMKSEIVKNEIRRTLSKMA